jgi:hypothetical protein
MDLTLESPNLTMFLEFYPEHINWTVLIKDAILEGGNTMLEVLREDLKYNLGITLPERL